MPNRRVLVVDDNDDSREFFTTTLSNRGFDVVAVENGRAALDRLSTDGTSFALILLDVMMPDMDGWTFLDLRRANPALRAVPVVLVSAHPGVFAAARTFGVKDALQKPVSPRELLRVAESHCPP